MFAVFIPFFSPFAYPSRLHRAPRWLLHRLPPIVLGSSPPCGLPRPRAHALLLARSRRLPRRLPLQRHLRSLPRRDAQPPGDERYHSSTWNRHVPSSSLHAVLAIVELIVGRLLRWLRALYARVPSARVCLLGRSACSICHRWKRVGRSVKRTPISPVGIIPTLRLMLDDYPRPAPVPA